MRNIKMYGSAALATLAAAAAFGATSASAANWDPPNVTIPGTGTLVLTTNTGASVDCRITISMRSTGNDLSTSTAPPVFDGCSSNIANPTVVTSSTNWTATATTTTFVDVTGAANINIGSGLCVITASASVANNTWNNTTHTLTPNSGVNFPITEHGFCDGGTTGHMSGDVVFHGDATIT